MEYGFVTFFVASYPLAPMFALVSNLLEHRLDAFKYVTRYRRPIPKRVSGIGSWNGILLGMTYFSTVTNVSRTKLKKIFLNKSTSCVYIQYFSF